MLLELLEMAPGGVEESTLPDGTVEYSVYGSPGELPALPELTAAAGGALVEVRTEEVADDWDQRWRQFHQPLVIDDRLTVRPPWEPVTGETQLDVVIDPGQAFGTGSHPSTRLCLELLWEISFARRKESPTLGPLVDLGCGSGVLAITAAKLGYGPVLALDNDPAAIEATLQNASANAVELEVERFDLRVDELPAAATVLANLLAPLLITLAPHIPAGIESLIASGVLNGEADAVAAAFARRGMALRDRRDDAGWSALLVG